MAQKFRIWAERRTTVWVKSPYGFMQEFRCEPYRQWFLYDPFTRGESTHPSFKHALSAMQGVLNMERFLKSSTERR